MRHSVSAVSCAIIAAMSSACSDSTGPSQRTTVQPTITAGSAHTCMLAASGVASCWGSNFSGELGNGSTIGSVRPVPVSGGITFTTIAAGQSYTCGLHPAGAAYCWGLNGQGQLGNGTAPNPSAVPIAVSDGLTFTGITAGGDHTCAVTMSGATYCWGSNSNGESGNISSSYSTPTAIVGTQRFTLVTAGGSHTCGLTSTGAAYCWGRDSDGQVGN